MNEQNSKLQATTLLKVSNKFCVVSELPVNYSILHLMNFAQFL